MPDATITSTASTFGTITGTFAADQSTITGTVTGVVVGTLDGSVGVPGIGVPDGGTTGQVLKKASNTSYDTVWGTDLASAAWGTITGTLSSQTDLNTALGLKYDASNPSGFITSAALSPYLTSATAAATYQTIAGMSSYLTTSAAASTYQTQAGMSSYLTTATAASTYAPLASPTFTGTVTIPAGASISGYLTSATAASTYQTLSGMSSYLTTSAAASTYAPLASPTFTGTVTIPAGASISGYATTASLSSYAPLASPALTGTPTSTTAAADTNTTQIATTAYVVGQGYAKLASPTFSGAPSLPTGTIAVTQSAGDNTTAVATTAFVQQEVPAASTTAAGKVELATNAEAIVGTSATLVNPLNNVPAITTRPELRSLAAINSTIVSGSGGATLPAVTCGLREMFLGSLAAGRSSFVLGQNGTGALSNLMSRADWRVINFSKKIWMSGKAMTGTSTAFGATNYIGDANTSCRITLGGYSTNTTGDMTQKGIGWKKVGGTSSYFTLTVHNGTTLTDVATTVQQSDNNVIDWLIYSDGTGNVTLYINGSQAATTAAGPTGNTTVSYVAYREQVEAVSTPTVRQIMECTGGWLYIEG